MFGNTGEISIEGKITVNNYTAYGHGKRDKVGANCVGIESSYYTGFKWLYQMVKYTKKKREKEPFI
jgi:hypothetical protein